MNEEKKQLSVTVGIGTCYGEWFLVETAKTIRASKGVDSFRFVIVADRTPLSKEIQSGLKNLNVEYYWNEKEVSFLRKIKQIVDITDSDLFIATQDDITFQPDTIKLIIEAFEKNPEATMLGARILPLSPINFFESCIASMVRMVDYIGMKWNNKQNHLMVSGRCLAFRTNHIKKFQYIEDVITGDMYYFLENERLGGKFIRPDNAIVYIRCPQHIKDQIGPSSRYQYSAKELSRFFGDVNRFYKIPTLALIKGTIYEFIRHPISVIGYIGIFGYTRIMKQKNDKILAPMWDVDKTTKNI